MYFKMNLVMQIANRYLLQLHQVQQVETIQMHQLQTKLQGGI